MTCASRIRGDDRGNHTFASSRLPIKPLPAISTSRTPRTRLVALREINGLHVQRVAIEVKRRLSRESCAIAQKDIDRMGSSTSCQRRQFPFQFASALYIAGLLLPSGCIRVFELGEVKAIAADTWAFRTRQLQPHMIPKGGDGLPGGSPPTANFDKWNEMFSGKT